MPGPGRISERSQVAGPKMNRLLLGWLRPVRERKAESRQRLRPSGPTARSSRRSWPSAWRSSRRGCSAG